MADRKFIYAYGNGNDGERHSYMIALNDNDCPWALAEVMIPNRFIPGRKERSFAYKNVMVDGDEDHGIYATLHEGMRGETEMGAAYMTATLTLRQNDWYDDLQEVSVKDFLDSYTYRRYLKIKKK